MTQNQLSLGEELKEQGMARAEAAVDDSWKARVTSLVKTICRKREHFTTDIIWVAMELNKIPSPAEPRALGALLNSISKRYGWCKPTERHVKSKRKEAHARPLRVWRSTISEQKGEV